MTLVVARGIQDGNVSSLDEVPSDQQILLVWRNLDVVRSDDGLSLSRVVETLDVLEVGDIQSSDMVTKRDGEVCPLAIVSDIRIDGYGVLGLVSKVVKKLGNALFAVCVLSERIDDPDLTRVDSTTS